MNVGRIVSFGASALAIASWFASASTPVVRPPIVPLPPPRVAAIDLSVTALQADITRLHDRLGPTVVPSGSRDLFRFSARVSKPVSVAETKREAPALVEALSPVVFRPPLNLIGVAEDLSAEGPVRTAIVSGLGDVFLVKMGEMISGKYRVDLVSADAVQLTDISTAASTTLSLH